VWIPCGGGTGDRPERGRVAEARLSSDQQDVATSGREAVGEDSDALQLGGSARQFAGHVAHMASRRNPERSGNHR
jgi:hypothetical protein